MNPEIDKNEKYPERTYFEGVFNMQRLCLVFLIIFTLLMFTSCDKEQVNNNDKTNSPTETALQKPNNKELITTENQQISRTAETNLVYKNNKCGYQLTFPESWRGYYIIDEGENNSVSVNFFGKSKMGTIWLKDSGENGIPMFMIVDKSIINNNSLDNVKKIGEVNNVSYFYGTPNTAVLLNALSYGSQVDGTKNDETENELAKQDWEKVNKMLLEEDELLKTFKPIQ